MTETELITKQEFEDFLEMQDRICELIELKTIELSMILHGRKPEGERCELNIAESEFAPGCISVEYDIYSCGERCADQFELPFRFLYDFSYPTIYKLEHDEKLRKIKEQREEMNRVDGERKAREFEDHEKRVYLRLKEKFENLE